jgi:hypothetical protein
VAGDAGGEWRSRWLSPRCLLDPLRAQWREEMYRWLDQHRGVSVEGLAQESELIDFMSRSPAEQERSSRATIGVGAERRS